MNVRWRQAFLLLSALLVLSAGPALGAPIQNKTEYLKQRNRLTARDAKLRFDADVRLNDTEARVNSCLIKYREREIEKYRKAHKNHEVFPPAEYFPKVKSDIEASKLFPIIKRMPKGGALHIHSSLAGRAEWIVKKASEIDSCYVYWPRPGEAVSSEHALGELRIPAAGKTPPAGYRKVAQVRGADPGFDTKLLRLILLGEKYETSADIWGDFGRCFTRVAGFVQSDLVYPEYYADAFRTLLADNVQYVELRAKNNQKNFLKRAAEAIKKDTPEFDLKIILANSRTGTDPDEIGDDLQTAIRAHKADPSYIIGFDLVGQEDIGRTTFEYLDSFVAIARDSAIPFFFHDGESDWPSDTNLYDAYLLGSRRIGHGLNLYLFPNLEDMFASKKTGIALEVCPISNQMLHYTRDLRTHPAARYIRKGIPIVLSSDDPLIFGNHGLSYDFWEAFWAWELDLKALKKLAMNSIEYSGMSPSEKSNHLDIWSQKWRTFVDYEYNNLNKELFKGCVE